MFFVGTGTVVFLSMIIIHSTVSTALYNNKYVGCGQYGFSCEGLTKLRLCEENRLFGPAFNCPSNSVCNEDSVDICDNSINYVDPTVSRTLRCHRYERVVDPSVPNCKGYILCIPNKNRFQGIKFKCSGHTIFNGLTRTCSAPDRYKCPVYETSLTTPNIYNENTDKSSIYTNNGVDRMSSGHHNRPIDCKSYKFVVTQDKSLVRATYFCPPRPVNGESKVRCTIFSNQFCITLERDDQDQYIQRTGAAYRKPRLNNATILLSP